MTKLRNAGAASILALALAVTLFTTGAFAQSTQVVRSTSAQASSAAMVAHILTGGGPIPAAHAAPAPIIHRTYIVHRSYQPVYVASTSVASAGCDGLFGDCGGWFGGFGGWSGGCGNLFGGGLFDGWGW